MRLISAPDSMLDLIMQRVRIRTHVCRRCVMNACAVGFLPTKIAVDNSQCSQPLPSMSHSSDEYGAHHATPRLLLQAGAASLKSLN